MTNAEQKKYDTLQSTLREVQLEREALRGEVTAQRNLIDTLTDQGNKWRLNFFRVSNALNTVQHSVTMVTGALALENIELGYVIETVHTTEKQA